MNDIEQLREAIRRELDGLLPSPPTRGFLKRARRRRAGHVAGVALLSVAVLAGIALPLKALAPLSGRVQPGTSTDLTANQTASPSGTADKLVFSCGSEGDPIRLSSSVVTLRDNGTVQWESQGETTAMQIVLFEAPPDGSVPEPNVQATLWNIRAGSGVALLPSMPIEPGPRWAQCWFPADPGVSQAAPKPDPLLGAPLEFVPGAQPEPSPPTMGDSVVFGTFPAGNPKSCPEQLPSAPAEGVQQEITKKLMLTADAGSWPWEDVDPSTQALFASQEDYERALSGIWPGFDLSIMSSVPPGSGDAVASIVDGACGTGAWPTSFVAVRAELLGGGDKQAVGAVDLVFVSRPEGPKLWLALPGDRSSVSSSSPGVTAYPQTINQMLALPADWEGLSGEALANHLGLVQTRAEDCNSGWTKTQGEMGWCADNASDLNLRQPQARAMLSLLHGETLDSPTAYRGIAISLVDEVQSQGDRAKAAELQWWLLDRARYIARDPNADAITDTPAPVITVTPAASGENTIVISGMQMTYPYVPDEVRGALPDAGFAGLSFNAAWSGDVSPGPVECEVRLLAADGTDLGGIRGGWTQGTREVTFPESGNEPYAVSGVPTHVAWACSGAK
jgi:hypothetical protein